MRLAAPLCLATLAGVVLAAAHPAALDWPFGKTSELPSPDGRHTIYGERAQPGVRDAPELWLRHRGRSERRRLLELTSNARAFWSQDSRSFVIVDRAASNTMTSFICDSKGGVVLEIDGALLQYDPELRAVANGHFYVEAQRFLDARTVRVAAFGHTDDMPVRCFRFVYSVSLDGRVKRLSKRVSPATATACDETSE
jgi:hypothetical protein